MSADTHWTHRGIAYHRTTWSCAPGYGAEARCLTCDWHQSWGDYNGLYNGWRGGLDVEAACFEHEQATRQPAPVHHGRAILGALAILTTAAVILSAPAAPASAATWRPPDGAKVTSVRVTRTEHTVRTVIRWRPLNHWTPAPEDLIGSVECRADSQTTTESDWWVDERANTIRRDHVQTLTGTCRTLNVQVAPAHNVSEGYEWATSWSQSVEITPVGVWAVPWEAERIETMPSLPYLGHERRTVIVKRR